MKSISNSYNSVIDGKTVTSRQEFIAFGKSMLEGLGLSKFKALKIVNDLSTDNMSVTDMLESLEKYVDHFSSDYCDTSESIVRAIMGNIINNEQVSRSLVEKAVNTGVDNSIKIFMHHASRIASLADTEGVVSLELYESKELKPLEYTFETPTSLIFAIDNIKRTSQLFLDEALSNTVDQNTFNMLVSMNEQFKYIKESYVELIENLNTEFSMTLQLFNSMISSNNSDSYYYTAQKLAKSTTVQIEIFIYLCMVALLNKVYTYRGHMVQVYGYQKVDALKNFIESFAQEYHILVPIKSVPNKDISFSSAYTCLDRINSLTAELKKRKTTVLNFYRLIKPMLDYQRLNFGKIQSLSTVTPVL